MKKKPLLQFPLIIILAPFLYNNHIGVKLNKQYQFYVILQIVYLNSLLIWKFILLKKSNQPNKLEKEPEWSILICFQIVALSDCAAEPRHVTSGVLGDGLDVPFQALK